MSAKILLYVTKTWEHDTHFGLENCVETKSHVANYALTGSSLNNGIEVNTASNSDVVIIRI